jgi:predicted esterase
MKRYFFCAIIIILGIAATGFSNNPAVKDRAKAVAEYKTDDVTFISDFDDTAQKYAIMTPVTDSSNCVRDLMVALHGYGSDRWQYINGPLSECAASRDVAMENEMIYVSPDYRITNWMGPAAQADVLKIIKDIKKKYRIGRVFITGASMGGSSCLTFTALHPDVIDGVASLNGMANYLEYVFFQDSICKSFGGSKIEAFKEFKKRSAEYWPEKFTMPIGITAGRMDTVVPPDSVLRLANTLKILKRDVMLICQEKGAHSTNYDDARAVLEFVVQRAKKTTTLRKLNGFDRIIETIPAQKTRYNSGFFGVLTSHFIRQTDGKGIISWRSKPLTKENINDEGEASFQWPATTGWVTDPDGDFTLLVNGKELLKFDVSNTTISWPIPGQALQERTGLTYDVKGFTPTGDSTGIMTLTLPAGTVKVGESIEIGVKGSASNSKRFFMLYETP